MSVQGQNAIVTGSGRGIGRAIAEEFARDGANVIVTARSTDEVNAVVETIDSEMSGSAIAVPGDISDPAHVGTLFDTAREAWGGVDILVNNAAISYPFDATEDSVEDFDGLFEINFYGSLRCALEAAREFKSRQEASDEIPEPNGHILNISSVHSRFSEAGMVHYDAAKGAMDAMTRTLAIDLAPHGVLVNGIAPGFIETQMSIKDGESELEEDWFQDYYVDQRKIPLARAAQPVEVAKLARFIVSQENTYMTGQTVFQDGGLSITF